MKLFDEIHKHFDESSERATAVEVFVEVDNRFEHEFGTGGGIDLEYQPPDVKPFEINLSRTLPYFEEEAGELYESPRELMLAIQEYFRDHWAGISVSDGSVSLIPGFQIISEFGREIDRNPIRYLIINAEWEID